MRQQFSEQVSIMGSNVEFKYTTSSVAAAGSVSLYLDTICNIDVTKYKQVIIAINASDTVTHVFSANLQYFENGISGYNKFGVATVVASANQYYNCSGVIDYLGNHPLLQITNSDTVAHVYNIIIKFRTQ